MPPPVTPPGQIRVNAYTTAADVQMQLGRTLTAQQIAYLESNIIPAATEWVDATGGREYGIGAVTAEPLVMAAPYTWLEVVPVASITQIRGWFWGQTVADVQALDASLYALVDASVGYLWLPSYTSYEYLAVDYVPDPTVPNSISLATAILCGFYMRTVIHPESEWLTDYASGQDIRVKFKELKIPDMVYELVTSTSGSVSGGWVVA